MYTHCKFINRTVKSISALVFAVLWISCSDDPSDIISMNTGNDGTLTLTYPIVDTNQDSYFNNEQVIPEPGPGEKFYGQDSQYSGNQPSYTDNGDRTITDNVTGLMWEVGFRRSDFDEASGYAMAATTGGYTDWRVPTNKELYSLIDFTGNQGSGNPEATTPPGDAAPFIDTDYFEFEYPTVGRYIDAQYLTSTEYVGTVMNGEEAFFGVNLADGRIKGYPQDGGDFPTDEGRWYLRLVRGNTVYGQNDFLDNGDGTITDGATGLMWMQNDSGSDLFANSLSEYSNDDGSMNWEEALQFAENLEYAGYGDWRLPNAKELHSIVDYTRAPDVTGSPAINSVFNATEIVNEAGNNDYPFYWSSTTFEPGTDAIIFQFGRSLGYFNGEFLDVHGAGGQRTDLKAGEPTYGFGPQGDVRRVYNYVRLVRNAD